MNHQAEEYSQNSHQFGIHFLCETSETSQEGLQKLLNSILALPFSFKLNTLAGIWIVANSEIPNHINQIIQHLEKTPGTYKTGFHQPEGVAIPLQLDESSVSIILLEVSLISSLTGENFQNPNTISTIIEELLHVHIYTIRYMTHGYIKPQITASSCDFDFINLATTLHDEYSVSSLKQKLLPTITFAYGLSVEKCLDEAKTEILKIIEFALSGKISSQDAWSQILRAVYRKIFDPLVRSFGFQDALINREKREGENPDESSFYIDYVKTYWEQIHIKLKASVDGDFQNMEATCSEIANLIKAFMANLGIDIYQLDTGEC